MFIFYFTLIQVKIGLHPHHPLFLVFVFSLPTAHEDISGLGIGEAQPYPLILLSALLRLRLPYLHNP